MLAVDDRLRQRRQQVPGHDQVLEPAQVGQHGGQAVDLVVAESEHLDTCELEHLGRDASQPALAQVKLDLTFGVGADPKAKAVVPRLAARLFAKHRSVCVVALS